MYSEDDVSSAVAAGAMDSEAASALRAHVAAIRQTPASDEENFRLINSFNDIFVTIASVLLLVAMAGIGQAFMPIVDSPPPISGLLVAAAAWGLAEFFTLKRRMALPSIVLLLAFVGGVFEALIGFAVMLTDGAKPTESIIAVLFAACALGAAGAALAHWRRFKVPITIAAGAGAVAMMTIALIMAAIGPIAIGDFETNLVLLLVFLAGLMIFAYAMRWDMGDRARTTRRSDVAFWLHLLAAPLIAHPLFHWLGVTGGPDIGASAAVGVLLAYIAMGLVALVVDRRALLVSALAYVLVTLTWLFDKFGAVNLNVALTALVIGSALLTLSAFWTPIRRAIVLQLPGKLQERLPPVGISPAA